MTHLTQALKKKELLMHVIKALINLKEIKGASTKQIVDYVTERIKYDRSVVADVKKAIARGLAEGYFNQRGGRIHLTTEGLGRNQILKLKRKGKKCRVCGSGKNRRPRRGRRTSKLRRRIYRQAAVVESDEEASSKPAFSSTSSGTSGQGSRRRKGKEKKRKLKRLQERPERRPRRHRSHQPVPDSIVYPHLDPFVKNPPPETTVQEDLAQPAIGNSSKGQVKSANYYSGLME